MHLKYINASGNGNNTNTRETPRAVQETHSEPEGFGYTL